MHVTIDQTFSPRATSVSIILAGWDPRQNMF